MPVRRIPENILNSVVDDGDQLWNMLVDAIDWNRAILEAMTRHLDLDHDKDERDLESYICGECLAEALKTNYTFPKWKKG